jgi:L-2,4-diaminobutyrate transaminase
MAQASVFSASNELQDLDREHVLHPFSSLAAQASSGIIMAAEANGVTIRDRVGREYLDAASGLWCANIGYGRKAIAEAAAEQIAKMSYSHTFSTFSNEPMVRLSDRLLGLAPPNMSRVIFANSGSEANDTQIKLVRRYNNVRGKTAKKKIIARLSSYHGSTIGAGSLTGMPAIHRTFDLPIPGIIHTWAPDYHRRPEHIGTEEQFTRYLADELDKLIVAEGPDTVAAFIAEPITASGGVLVPPAGYFREIQKVLRKHDVLLIADEVVTGFGRTGSWFASPTMDAEPDLMTIAKGLTSGYFPMSACLISRKVSDVLYSEKTEDGMFAHGFTSSGHPVGAAIALANIDILESEKLPENSQVMGLYLIARLRERIGDHHLVGEIRGKGLLIGIEFDADRGARRAFENTAYVSSLLNRACFEEQLLVRGSFGRVIAAMAPPLILRESEADEIVVRLGRAVNRFAKSLEAENVCR